MTSLSQFSYQPELLRPAKKSGKIPQGHHLGSAGYRHDAHMIDLEIEWRRERDTTGCRIPRLQNPGPRVPGPQSFRQISPTASILKGKSSAYGGEKMALGKPAGKEKSMGRRRRVGTELQKRGLPRVSLRGWNISRRRMFAPSLSLTWRRGGDHLTNTFGGSPLKLAKVNLKAR